MKLARQKGVFAGKGRPEKGAGRYSTRSRGIRPGRDLFGQVEGYSIQAGRYSRDNARVSDTTADDSNESPQALGAPAQAGSGGRISGQRRGLEGFCVSGRGTTHPSWRKHRATHRAHVRAGATIRSGSDDQGTARRMRERTGDADTDLRRRQLHRHRERDRQLADKAERGIACKG